MWNDVSDWGGVQGAEESERTEHEGWKVGDDGRLSL